MRTYAITASAAGAIRNLAGGVGFQIEPAGTAPGSWPVTATFDDGDPRLQPIAIASARAFWPACEFRSLEFSGMPPSSTWNVFVFEDYAERLGPPSGRSRTVVNVQVPTVIQTANPSAANGIPIWPGYRALQVYLTGTVQDVELWVRSSAGNWILSEVIDSTQPNAVPGVLSRQVLFGGGRLCLRCAAGGTSAEIDAEAETG